LGLLANKRPPLPNPKLAWQRGLSSQPFYPKAFTLSNPTPLPTFWGQARLGRGGQSRRLENNDPIGGDFADGQVIVASGFASKLPKPPPIGGEFAGAQVIAE
jgi:hypothetical protein